MRSSALWLPALALLACGEPLASTSEQDPATDGHGADDHAPKVRLPLPSDEEIAELPPDGGPEFNRLVFEKSPYLAQHARNPVDWYPWGPEAFERAEAEDKPVFLSVGYSTCHWCHVMEHESFEDEEVAALLNEHFVCVKVDREERPDVDQVYMSVTQALTGRGGWPNTVFMAPDKQPFHAGTYFPKEGRPGRPGMMDLLPAVVAAWEDNREGLLENAGEITRAIENRNAGHPGEMLSVRTLQAAHDQYWTNFDGNYGGFGTSPKFPVPHNLRLLLRESLRTGDELGERMVSLTLERMRRGGIYDHVGFGFHRYSTDPYWFLPHFEKMLYDQALMVMALVDAWHATGEESFAETAREVMTYVLRDMTSPDGAFYSAEDADSEGEEGLFYLWRPEEVIAVLGEEEGALWNRVYDIREGGNFEEEATHQKTGESIPHLATDLSVTALALEMDEAELRARLEASREKLFQDREGRIHPLKDDKVLTDWNGLMIAAFSMAARTFGEPEYERAAVRAAEFALAHLRREDGRLWKRWRLGEAAFDGMLDDYAFLAMGLIELHQTTLDPRWLAAALELVEVANAHFWDTEGGGYFLAPDDGEALIVRPKEVYDGATPSGNSVMAENLVRLARLTGRPELEELSLGVMRAFSGDVGNSPSNHAHMLLALGFLIGPSYEVVIAGDRDAPDTAAMLAALRAPFFPNHVVLFRPDGEDEPPIAKLAPFVANQRAIDGKATAYVCRNQACQAPTTDVETMLAFTRPAATEPDDGEGGE